jgi:DNA-binding response OmpR family regulator
LPQVPEVATTHLTLVPAFNAPSILVVDDEESVRELLCDILESEGYKVTQADCGDAALALFDSGRYDAVFTDVGMPGMSGWELARAIRERDQHLPLAVITGWGEAVGSVEQEQAQVNWVLTKPFHIDRIIEVAQEVSKHHEESSGIVPANRLADSARIAINA